MAIKENREGLPGFPGYSEKGVKISNLLEAMFRMCGYDDNAIDSNQLIQLLAVPSTEAEDNETNEESFFE